MTDNCVMANGQAVINPQRHAFLLAERDPWGEPREAWTLEVSFHRSGAERVAVFGYN